MTRYFLIICSIVLFVRCNRISKEKKNIFEPERIGSVSFPLDSLTSFFNHFQVVKQGNRKLLYLLTAYNNRFVVYDIEKQEKINTFEINNDAKSPISIGSIPPSGFSLTSSDSLILYDFQNQRIFFGNENGDKELIISIRKYFPSEREYWGSAFQDAGPLMINDSILSVTGAVTAGKNPFREDQTSDFNLNIHTKEAYRTMVFPKIYKAGNYYSTTRLRPTRALDKKNNLLYYNYLNSDSIYILNYKTGKRTAFFASNINMLPTIETNDFDEFRSYEDGIKNQLIYNKSQGTFLAVYYNSYKDHIIRLGYKGVAGFNIQDYEDELYKDEKILSFYDVNTHDFLGNISIEGLGYDFMFFDEDSFYMLETSQNKSEDELVFTKFKYPDF